MPTCLPLVLRRCHDCGAASFRAGGKFRINAHHKLLDVWLLVLCTGCGTTAKLSVLERATVRSIPPDRLDRFHANDSGLVAEVLRDPAVHRRNRVALDWTGAWRLVAAGPGETIAVHFAAPIPVRPVRLIAEGCGFKRSEVERLIADGRIVSAQRLSGKISSDFELTLRC
ncbi:DUF1062 domain-containing protein [Symbioplanes lichenis]|uniref:DUF1062 domain-containing protein n=1 Tax=Symbioplanes lichenis TaxID=1629072 RepID=UPI0027387109|nr:DUF1062 domain-containing protein [Actinoplanes lichenis]